ncbi:MAG: DNA adenine methylase [Candidatus Riflebacteria bacterium]|nr:DNA adenine methylase [Candidatus Riflebacteria bacterium]
MIYSSPLRYPGGKGKWANFMRLLFEENSIIGGDYIEPFAGGAAVALHLLYSGYANRIFLNDINKSIYAFWYSTLHSNDKLCSLISDTKITIDEWYKQKSIQLNGNKHDLLELGFSTFFLNRTNRSGIILGGVIGGKGQRGNWQLDARFNKDDLIKRIQKIGQNSKKIKIFNQDARIFLNKNIKKFNKNSLIYLDPPYYVKGKGLYENHFQDNDHSELANQVKNNIPSKWVVSYDNVDFIKTLYSDCKMISYDLNYVVREFSRGSEVMFFSDDITIPNVKSPVSVLIPKGTKERISSSTLEFFLGA